MAKPYTRVFNPVNWKDGRSGNTPVKASNLRVNDDATVVLETRTIELREDLDGLEERVADIEENGTGGGTPVEPGVSDYNDLENKPVTIIPARTEAWHTYYDEDAETFADPDPYTAALVAHQQEIGIDLSNGWIVPCTTVENVKAAIKAKATIRLIGVIVNTRVMEDSDPNEPLMNGAYMPFDQTLNLSDFTDSASQGFPIPDMFRYEDDQYNRIIIRNATYFVESDQGGGTVLLNSVASGAKSLTGNIMGTVREGSFDPNYPMLISYMSDNKYELFIITSVSFTFPQSYEIAKGYEDFRPLAHFTHTDQETIELEHVTESLAASYGYTEANIDQWYEDHPEPASDASSEEWGIYYSVDRFFSMIEHGFVASLSDPRIISFLQNIKNIPYGTAIVDGQPITFHLGMKMDEGNSPITGMHFYADQYQISGITYESYIYVVPFLSFEDFTTTINGNTGKSPSQMTENLIVAVETYPLDSDSEPEPIYPETFEIVLKEETNTKTLNDEYVDFFPRTFELELPCYVTDMEEVYNHEPTYLFGKWVERGDRYVLITPAPSAMTGASDEMITISPVVASNVNEAMMICDNSQPFVDMETPLSEWMRCGIVCVYAGKLGQQLASELFNNTISPDTCVLVFRADECPDEDVYLNVIVTKTTGAKTASADSSSETGIKEIDKIQADSR